MSRRTKLWIFTASALLCIQAAASLVLPQSFALVALTDLIQLLLLVSGTIALLLATLSNRGRARMFWAMMTLGLGFWVAYQGLWCYFELLLRTDPDSSSTLFTLGEAYEKTGQTSRAIESYRKSLLQLDGWNGIARRKVRELGGAEPATRE